MDMKYHFETAWKLCISNLIPLVLLTLVVAAVSVVSIGILAPVALAGYTHSLLMLLTHNREPRVQDVFSQFRLFFPLLIFLIIVLVISGIGFTLFVLPGILFTIIIGYTCLYLLPVMVDKEYGLLDAVKTSINMVTHAPVTDHVIVFILFSALITVGGSSFIGFLFLQPFATLFLLSVYNEVK